MSDPIRFWRAVESLPGLAAVSAEWQCLLGKDFNLAKPFLRVRRGRAESYPRDGGLPYEVIQHGDDDFVGVCPESGETISLTKKQLVVLEVDRRLLGERIAGALALDTSGAEDGDGCVQLVGHFISATEKRYACFLAFPLGSTDLHDICSRLIANKHTPFILLTPTRQWGRLTTDTMLNLSGSVLVPLLESIVPIRPGELQAVKPLESFLSQTMGIVGERTDTDSEAGKNVFRRAGEVWIVTFAEKKIIVNDSLGIKYIATLLGLKGREIDAATLKSAATGNPLIKPLMGTEVFDDQTSRELLDDVKDVRQRLDEAKKYNDLGKQEHLQAKLHSLTEQLEAAHGLGNRRRMLKDEASKVRTSIKNAITRAIGKQFKRHPALARHLDTFIQSGWLLSYSPDPDVDWEL